MQSEEFAEAQIIIIAAKVRVSQTRQQNQLPSVVPSKYTPLHAYTHKCTYRQSLLVSSALVAGASPNLLADFTHQLSV